MRILLVSDIHANARALRAVLGKFDDADEVWCLGDIVEYGPCPAECVELVRKHCRYVVQGNHDRSFADFDPSAGKGGWAALDHHTVAAAEIDYLRALPASLSVQADGSAYRLVHGSPRDPLAGRLEPSTPTDALLTALDGCDESHILCGHTHIAMVTQAAGKRIINTGTIGQPRDGDYRAQCMVVDDGKLRFERVDYDLEGLEEDYAASCLPQAVNAEWVDYTRRGVVDVHGLQLGPFSRSRHCPARAGGAS